MIRKIVTINQEKCNGCGLCAAACHEGAIAIVDGKAVLLREDYCDGLGDCLPACPMDAIRIEEREAEAYNEAAVLAAKEEKEKKKASRPGISFDVPSQLLNFPVQLKLVSPNSPSWDQADLLIAADCTAFSYGNFHEDFIKGRSTAIGCPKLDGVQYADKLTQILMFNDIRSITLVRMEVPCCGGLANAVKLALQRSGKKIPFQTFIISRDGRILR